MPAGGFRPPGTNHLSMPKTIARLQMQVKRLTESSWTRVGSEPAFADRRQQPSPHAETTIPKEIQPNSRSRKESGINRRRPRNTGDERHANAHRDARPAPGSANCHESCVEPPRALSRRRRALVRLTDRYSQSSHSRKSSLRPSTTSKKRRWTLAVIGPRLPEPIVRSSISRTGVTSAAVPQKNTSSARYISSR